jgi:hypothetical protein
MKDSFIDRRHSYHHHQWCHSVLKIKLFTIKNKPVIDHLEGDEEDEDHDDDDRMRMVMMKMTSLSNKTFKPFGRQQQTLTNERTN